MCVVCGINRMHSVHGVCVCKCRCEIDANEQDFLFQDITGCAKIPSLMLGFWSRTLGHTWEWAQIGGETGQEGMETGASVRLALLVSNHPQREQRFPRESAPEGPARTAGRRGGPCGRRRNRRSRPGRGTAPRTPRTSQGK